MTFLMFVIVQKDL